MVTRAGRWTRQPVLHAQTAATEPLVWVWGSAHVETTLRPQRPGKGPYPGPSCLDAGLPSSLLIDQPGCVGMGGLTSRSPANL